MGIFFTMLQFQSLNTLSLKYLVKKSFLYKMLSQVATCSNNNSNQFVLFSCIYFFYLNFSKFESIRLDKKHPIISMKFEAIPIVEKFIMIIIFCQCFLISALPMLLDISTANAVWHQHCQCCLTSALPMLFDINTDSAVWYQHSLCFRNGLALLMTPSTSSCLPLQLFTSSNRWRGFIANLSYIF